jgi:hypothetical protein
MVGITDNVLDLYLNWVKSEFNIFGVQGGSQAIFNSGAVITVENAVANPYSGFFAPAPTCFSGGYTGESNNLNAGTCSNAHIFLLYTNEYEAITFTESNALEKLTTGVTSGKGSISVGKGPPNACSKYCLEEFGSGNFMKFPVTVTAKPSKSWYFSRWNPQSKGISCSLNPCTFSMPLNSVTLKADFIQAVPVTVYYSILNPFTGTFPGNVDFWYQNGTCPAGLCLGTYRALTATPYVVMAEVGSTWYVSPNPLTGPLKNERWELTGPARGTISSKTTTLVFKYQDQYYVTMKVNLPSGGSVKPKTGWYTATFLSYPTYKIVATTTACKPDLGLCYRFVKWTSSTLYISISDSTKESTTATIDGSGTITANFELIQY